MSRTSKLRKSVSTRRPRQRRADRARVAVLLCLLGAAPVGAAPVWAAPQAPADVSVSFRPPVGYVGEEVRFPVYLEGSGGKALRDLSLELRFPSKLMTFVDIEQGFLLQNRGAKIEHRIVTHDDATSAFVLTLSSEKGLPEGLFLYLKFRVDPSAPLGDEVPLKMLAEARVAPGEGSARVSVPVAADPFRISPRKKEDEFLFACFFYMH